MKINLNNPEEFTKDNVAKLIGSAFDSEHRQLRVTVEGIAFLSKDVGYANSDDILLLYDTWRSGKGYIGFKAQHNKQWIDRIYKSLKDNWPVNSFTYIENY